MSAFANGPEVLERLLFHMKESSTALETEERKDNDEAKAVQIDPNWIKMKVRPKRDMLHKIIRADQGVSLYLKGALMSVNFDCVFWL